MLKKKFVNKVLSVSFYKNNAQGTGIYDYSKKYNWDSDLNKGDNVDNYFLTKEKLTAFCSPVLVSGGCFGEDFETKDAVSFLLSSSIKIIIAERFSLPFLKIVEDMGAEIVLITLFRDTLYSDVLYRLISRKGSEFRTEIDENFKISLFLDEGYDYTKNMSIQVYSNNFVKFESFQIGTLKKNFLDLK